MKPTATSFPGCVVAILYNSKTTIVRSTRMLKTTEKRKMRLGVHVLLRSTFPNLGSAIPSTFEFQDRVYRSIVSFLLLEYRPMRSLLLGTLVFLMEVVPVYLRQLPVDKSYCDICLAVHGTLCERYQSVRCGRGILQKHLTNRYLVGTFCRSHHFSICPRSTNKFCCSFSYLVVHLLPCGDVHTTILVHACDLFKLK